MAEYRKSEAREWARAKMRGVANVIIPTFTHDLQGLNERAIRHDVRKEIEYGFWGALLVAETATTLPEYSQFATWAADEAKGKLHLIHHASFNTLEENIAAVQAAERAGHAAVNARAIGLWNAPCSSPAAVCAAPQYPQGRVRKAKITW